MDRTKEVAQAVKKCTLKELEIAKNKDSGFYPQTDFPKTCVLGKEVCALATDAHLNLGERLVVRLREW